MHLIVLVIVVTASVSATVIPVHNIHNAQNVHNNSILDHRASRTTWQSKGANITFIAYDKLLSGYLTTGNYGAELFGVIFRENDTAIMAWQVMWPPNAAVTSWNGYLQKNIIYATWMLTAHTGNPLKSTVNGTDVWRQVQ